MKHVGQDEALLEVLDKISNRIEFMNILINECGDECKDALMKSLRRKKDFIKAFEGFLNDVIT